MVPPLESVPRGVDPAFCVMESEAARMAEGSILVPCACAERDWANEAERAEASLPAVLTLAFTAVYICVK